MKYFFNLWYVLYNINKFDDKTNRTLQIFIRQKTLNSKNQ